MTDEDIVTTIIALRYKKVTPIDVARVLASEDGLSTTSILYRLRDAGSVTAEDCELVTQAAKESLDFFRASAATVIGAPFTFGVFSPQKDTSPHVHGHVFAHRYELRDELARGGMGCVYRAFDRTLRREVALKVQLGTVAADQDFRLKSDPLSAASVMLQRFVREAFVTAYLEHPSIVPIHDLGQDDGGTIYYAMKLIAGRTFEDALTEAGSIDNRLRLLPHFVDLCHAIAFAHSRGVVHRDLKPQNIMVGEYGETQLIDWGLAKMPEVGDDRESISRTTVSIDAADSAAHTHPGMVVGTPRYMAPEQAQGNAHIFDPRVDVYALGAILYRVLAGVAPFHGLGVQQILEQVVRNDPIAIRTLEPRAPAELVAICQRAMQKQSTDRYPSAKELADDVERFLHGDLVDAYEYRMIDHAWRFINKHRGAVATAALASLLVILLTNISLIQVTRERNFAQSMLNRFEAGAGAALVAPISNVRKITTSVLPLIVCPIQGDLAKSLAPEGLEMLQNALKENLKHSETLHVLGDADAVNSKIAAMRLVTSIERSEDSIHVTLSLFDANNSLLCTPVSQQAPNDLIQLRDGTLRELSLLLLQSVQNLTAARSSDEIPERKNMP